MESKNPHLANGEALSADTHATSLFPINHTQSVQATKYVYIQTWGCQMNVADSERMQAILTHQGFVTTQEAAYADLIILNTCNIREKARHKVVSRLGELKSLKLHNKNLVLAVSGCVASAESKILAQEAPFLDLIFGPDQIEMLPDLLQKTSSNRDNIAAVTKRNPLFVRDKIIQTKFDPNTAGYSIPVEDIKPWFDDKELSVSKFVNIIKGCNNFCTFCVVPYTRGREKSRPVVEIVKETQYFLDNHIPEITLLGQNVNSYGLDLLEEFNAKHNGATTQDIPIAKPQNFVDLLYTVGRMPGVERLRFTTSNPHDFTPNIAQAFADLPNLVDAFHLPVQSGSNRVLEKMRRQYTVEKYWEVVQWIRAVRPNMAFSTDIIVGFPGETDSEFMETYRLVEQMDYAFIYAFKYSPRKNTPAMRFQDQIPEHIKDARLQALLQLQNAKTLAQHQAFIGKTENIFMVYPNRKDETNQSFYGRTWQSRLVKVALPTPFVNPQEWLGKNVTVRITDCNITALEGVLA
jgi:tRNA-2-methylthio-N6-dimethylallyladenosine synthase